MHIILVSNRLTRTRTFTITAGHLVAGTLAVAAAVMALAGALFYVSVRHAAEIRLPAVQSLFRTAQKEQARKTDRILRENLDAMAVKLGQMQARLMRLDALGERLSGMVGLKPQEFRFDVIPGQGGAVSSTSQSRDLSSEEFTRQLGDLSKRIEGRADYLGVLESAMFDARAQMRLLPTSTPVETRWDASDFGWRIDPINGRRAFHEGIDFIADAGSPVFAAAGGVVVYAGYHPQYGNMIEIDHGNDYTTRYAHGSKLFVKVGEVVRRGRKIAEVGSSGRSTGPHLHFEVRYKGIAANPVRFLHAAAR